mmetsp:Transcript_10655/g.13832  ORF Transcript_10655/g.13832 Transcript_10655/m.13832 type:complete len:282 (+) Transcript_10655:114-959(+)
MASSMILSRISRVLQPRKTILNCYSKLKCTTTIAREIHGTFQIHQLLKQIRPYPATMMKRTMFIQTQDTPNPSSLKFLPNRDVLPENSSTGFYYQRSDRKEWQAQSPLARKLFAIEGVKAIFLGQDFVTITKEPDEAWQPLRPQVFSAIMDFYSEGEPAITDEPMVTDTTIMDDDSEVVMMIKELLEERIRPAVQEDGGDIFFHKFDEATGIVHVQLAGACSGCPSSSITLKNGVENMMMHYIPEVKGIEEYVDDELVQVNEKAVNSLEDRLKKAGIPYDH